MSFGTIRLKALPGPVTDRPQLAYGGKMELTAEEYGAFEAWVKEHGEHLSGLMFWEGEKSAMIGGLRVYLELRKREPAFDLYAEAGRDKVCKVGSFRETGDGWKFVDCF